MPLEKLEIKPGVVKDRSPYASKGRWIDTQWVRFDEGQPRKMGGWAPAVTGDSLPIQDITGARKWTDFLSTPMTVLTTKHNLKVIDPKNVDPGLIDITPAYIVDAIDNPVNAAGPSFAATNGSEVFTCVVTNGMSGWTPTVPIGTVVQFTGALPIGTVGGVDIPREVVVTAVDGGGYSFDFALADEATSTENVNVSGLYATFTIQDTDTLTGAASGAYGDGAYGIGPYGAATSVGTTTPFWSYDTFGQLYIATQDGIGPVVWCEADGTPPAFGTADPSTTIRAIPFAQLNGADPETPTDADLIMSSGTSRHIILGGTNDTATNAYNPLLLRWASQESLTEWYPRSTNTAGDYPLSDGSYIVTGTRLRRESLVWTDTALYSVQYIGGQEVFSVNAIATNISITSPRAIAVHNDTVYWMGTDKFYKYDGRVAEIDCPISSYVFSGVTDFSTVHAGLNLAHNEVMFFYGGQYPGGAIEGYYALFNFHEGSWANGQRWRTMWYDTASLYQPMAAEGTALLDHEVGANGNSGTGAVPIPAHIESADMDIASGEQFSFVRRIIPDVDFSGSGQLATVDMELVPRRAPGRNVGVSSKPNGGVRTATAEVTPYTERVGVRLRARQLRLKVASTEADVMWGLGTQRIDAQPDGGK